MPPQGKGGGSEDHGANEVSDDIVPINVNASNGVRVIIDGLLCSIVKAISRFPNDHEFVNIIETAIVETEVKEAWVKLFSYFNDVLDEVRKIPIIEIRRQSKRLMIEDIVKLIRRKDLLSDCHIFVLPWFYNINPFVTENQRIGGIWQKETVVETEKRFNDLESRIEARLEQKHRDLMANLKIWSDNVIKTVQPAYASAVQNNSFTAASHSGNGFVPTASHVGPNIKTGNNHLMPFNFPPISSQSQRRTPSVSSLSGIEPRSRVSSLSGGAKRARIETETKEAKKKPVVIGTGTFKSTSNRRKLKVSTCLYFCLGNAS